MKSSKGQIRKILAMVLVLTLCLTAAAALVACDKTPPTPSTFTVNFTGDEVSIEAKTVNSGETVQKPANPTREGYVFVCWLLNGEEFSFDTPITSDITLVAKWVEVTSSLTATFVFANGQNDLVCDIVDGKVEEIAEPTREGYVFKFWAIAGENVPFDFNTTVTESIVLVAQWQKKTSSVTVTYVYGNGQDNLVRNVVGGKVVEIASPSREGFVFLHWSLSGETTPFDFNSTVTESIVLIAQWREKNDKRRLHWDENEIVKFVFDGEVPSEANVGDTVKFKINISPYYIGSPIVVAGTKEVNCDADGVYSFVVADEVTVSVSGLVYDNTPMSGRGTQYDPYVIKTHAQFKTFTDGVNNKEDNSYNTAYFKLGADLDFKGVTIDPIGVDLYYNTMFSGNFDGNGHTVSNFVLSNECEAAGLFGFVNNAYISNLNVVADIDVEVLETGLFVGGIAAYNFASDIVGCTYKGTINVAHGVSSDQISVLVGGIVGFMQGEGSTSADAYTATVAYCTADADIHISGSYEVNSVGGVAGAMVGLSGLGTANIYNCSADITIDGYAKRAGGIVGWMRQLSSVDNCFAIGTLDVWGIAEDPVVGGIVGESYNENALTYSLSAVELVGVSNAEEAGVIGLKHPAKLMYVDDRETVLIGNYYADGGSVTVGSVTYDVTVLADVLRLMDWNALEWREKDGVISAIPDSVGLVAMDVTFKFLSSYNGHTEATLSDMIVNDKDIFGYVPISYVFDGDGLNTLTADDGKISFGYFLDEELTVRVPASFLLTGHKTTIYIGFADYSLMEGEYKAVIGDINVDLTFDDNGMMTMYTEGRRAYYMYVFDGEKAVIHDGYFLYIYMMYLGRPTTNANYTLDYYAEFTDNGLKIYDGEIFSENGAVAAPITAIRDNGLLGEWYTMGETSVYTFYADGTGSISTGGQFTYTVKVKTVTIKIGNKIITARLSDDGRTMQTSDGSTLSITKYDDFNGAWESDFNDCVKVKFNGVNTAVIGSESFTYYIEDGVLISEGLSARFDENGLLVLEYGGKTLTLGREGSCIGTWQDTGLNYQFILFGINKDGYGLGYDSYGNDFTYVYDDGELNMFHRTSAYGFGNVSIIPATDDENEIAMLALAMFTPASGSLVDDYNMTYIDKFEGNWNSDSGISLAFNGNGAYDIFMTTSDNMVWDVRGFVTVTENGQSETVRYHYDRATVTATFTYKEIECEVRVADNGISVNFGNETILFTTPDALSVNDWYAEGIEKISFDGKGNAGEGNVTMTVGGEELEYKYAYSEDGKTVSILDGGVAIYILNLDGMVLSNADGSEIGALGVYSRILGTVYTVYGTSGPFELDCTQKFDADGIARGVWSGIDVIFSNFAKDTIAVYDASMSSVAFYLIYVDENTVIIATINAAGEFVANNVAYIPDELMGVYYNSDASVKLEFDGASNNSYIFAGATFTEIDENGDQIADENKYVYFSENGKFGIYTYVRKDDGTLEYTLVYSVSLQAADGATAYSTKDGSKTVWIKEA